MVSSETNQQQNAGKRRYLSSAERKTDILDAAFEAFARHGYTGTSIEAIAARAGLSKAGIYAHFKGKADIFEMLLTRAYMPQEVAIDGWWKEELSLPDMIAHYVEHIYTHMANPVHMDMLRLMISESERLPELVRHWHRVVLGQYLAREQAVVSAFAEKGYMRKGVLTEHFQLSVAPLMMWVNMSLVLREDCPIPLEKIKQMHKQLLLELLDPAR